MTSVVNEVMEAVIEVMNGSRPFAVVTRGALPTVEGITCEIGPSRPQEVYLDKNSYLPLDVTINAKHPDLKLLSDTLNTFHSTLTRARSYPEDSGGRWKIVDITTLTMPQIIGREENNDWLMASSLSVRFFWKGE
jgi:hypothetical protein